jgi:heme-degrading monooxygenase HmoA
MVFVIFEFWPDPAHRAAQAAGRETRFKNYRLRIAEVIRDYGLKERTQAPVDSKQTHG